MVTREQVMHAMESVIDPELRRNVVELEMVRDVEIDDGRVSLTIVLTVPGCPLKSSFVDQVNREVGALDGVESVDVSFASMTDDERTALGERLGRGGRQRRTVGVNLPQQCRVVAVTSGKGGVGKSTFTTNLAVAMARRGKEVGVLDADVYGFSIPQMLGIDQSPVVVDGKLVPPVAHDVRAMSIGFFLEDDGAVMWRGPMLHRALEQFLGDVHWGDVEYLFIDMPPGTGDVALSLGRLLPRAEVVVVTTPQVAAQVVARRAALVAEKMEQSVLGVVENMSDPEGGPSVFGRGGGAALADQLGVPLLGTVPLDPAVREGGDAGAPVVTTGAAVGAAFDEVAAAIDAVAAPTLPPPPPQQRIKKPLVTL